MVKRYVERLKKQPVAAKLRSAWAGPPVVPVVRLNGVIASGGGLRRNLNLAGVSQALEQAFSIKSAKAVALSINSPGGSPVQSSLIFKRIRQLAGEKELPVYAFVEDVAASGGYMLACAADEIYADESSILGSIGVISAGFGLTGLIEKIGVERRVYTSGKSKATLDPFLPEKEEDVSRLKALQEEVHANFIDLVKSRRGERLQGPEEELFSGAFWAGQSSIDRGLADGLGDMRSKLRDFYGDKVKLKVIGGSGPWWRRNVMAEGAERLGAVLPESLLESAEARAQWSRFGL